MAAEEAEDMRLCGPQMQDRNGAQLRLCLDIHLRLAVPSSMSGSMRSLRGSYAANPPNGSLDRAGMPETFFKKHVRADCSLGARLNL